MRIHTASTGVKWIGMIEMIAMPEYFEWIEWEYIDGVPVMKGFREDAPKDKIPKWKKQMRELQRMIEEHPDDCII